jgi:hypothetical protein
MSPSPDDLRATVGAAYLQLRALRNTCRDTLAAIAALLDELEPVLELVGLNQLDGTAKKEAQPDESRTRHPRCLV